MATNKQKHIKRTSGHTFADLEALFHPVAGPRVIAAHCDGDHIYYTTQPAHDTRLRTPRTHHVVMG